MLTFDNRVVVITGAGRGLGRQHALLLAERGARVVVNDYGGGLKGENGNNPQPADEVVAAIRAAGGTAIAACCDIGERKQAESMVDAAIVEFGRVDAVIHNASVYATLGPFTEASPEDLERVLRVNVNGGWHVTQAAWRQMVKQGYGRIVLTGSGAGFFGRRTDQAYSAAKAALMGLVKVLAAEGVSLGIKANLVGPIAWTEHAKAQKAPSFMAQVAPPILVTNLVAMLVHEQCPVSGEMFHCGAGFVSRVFVAETEGVVFDPATMTPETVLASLDQIMSEPGYYVPRHSNKSHIFAAVSKANPAAAKLIAEARNQQKK
jgi:NAD(P)-dependent dehydrogenase (short-subunit alcohol dehydrogenase family)